MKSAAIAFLFFSALPVATAQNNRTDSSMRTDREAARAELREHLQEWARTSVFPTLAEWKGELERAMSAEDLQTLNRLRSEAKPLRGKIREQLRGLREAWKSEDEAAIRQGRAALSETRKAWLDILDELEPLAFRYRESLKEIATNGRQTVKDWKKEGKEIVLRWHEEYRDILSDDLRNILNRSDLPIKWFGGTHLKRKRVAQFMLWDGDTLFDGGDREQRDRPDLY